jgi:hydroxylamine dehydrogenase
MKFGFGILTAIMALSAFSVTNIAMASDCAGCHEKENSSLVSQWKNSRHFEAGVGCIDCHQAEKGEADAFEHNGAVIATIVSPKDCAKCHEDEVTQNSASRHAHAAQFIGSLDNIVGEIIEGAPAANSGCRQCHGSEVKVMADGKLDPATWPNTGIGRVNPDGSLGSCSACHMRHSFSVAQAREPENCGRCHLGPDHPQSEIFAESKHGIKYRSSISQMNLDSQSWILGTDYFAAPTCATCHMSATKNQAVNHDVGLRLSWTLRPAISVHQEGWEAKRTNMKDVCQSCHGSEWVGNFFMQFDNAVSLYNDKFATPAKAIMDDLKAANKISATPFDDKIEWTYYELWHHQGRRARHGAAMMGPDYTQWHGFYEVAKSFYFDFIPEAEELLPGISKKYLSNPMHQWRKGMTPEQIKEQIDYYKNRYGE